jgi:hypothetical protein
VYQDAINLLSFSWQTKGREEYSQAIQDALIRQFEASDIVMEHIFVELRAVPLIFPLVFASLS